MITKIASSLAELDNIDYILATIATDMLEYVYIEELTEKVEELLQHKSFAIIHNSLYGDTMYIKQPYCNWYKLVNSQRALINQQYNPNANQYLIKCWDETDYLILKTVLV